MLHRSLFLLLAAGALPSVQAQQSGEAMFKSFCSACHTLGKGKLIGPDLAGVNTRHPEEWLIEFVKGSQAMIQKGDAVAVALFNENNQTLMPDAPYTVEEIRTILGYIRSAGGETTDMVTAQPQPEVPSRSVNEATEAEIGHGQMLFVGEARLEGGGPGCISCHHVKNDALVGGGLLAKELTDVFTRMNEAGISAILTSPPFPAMREAYQAAPISESEAFALIAFLKKADEDQFGQHPRDYKQYFLIAGGTSFLVLLAVYSLVWAGRRKQAVSQKIFNRQVYS
jgi:mono/diheme cytochrome c family protein